MKRTISALPSALQVIATIYRSFTFFGPDSSARTFAIQGGSQNNQRPPNPHRTELTHGQLFIRLWVYLQDYIDSISTTMVETPQNENGTAGNNPPICFALRNLSAVEWTGKRINTR